MTDQRTQLARILDALEEGPGTASEIAADTGLPMKHCSAYLTALKSLGVVTVTGDAMREPWSEGRRGRRAAHIYQLVGQGATCNTCNVSGEPA